MTNNHFSWAVIGAGPAGIAAIGNLLDIGIEPETIAWLDPHFTVGDLGDKWQQVPSNTLVKTFSKFLEACRSFEYSKFAREFNFYQLDSEDTCKLHHVFEPLLRVSQILQTKVHCYQTTVDRLSLQDRTWLLEANEQLTANNVILAIGAEAKTLSYQNIKTIPLADAMDSNRLKKVCDSNDTVAVFGSSHSAVLAMRWLVENPVKKIINFYRSAFCYAVYYDDYILFDDTGLKGSAAKWAKQNLHGNLPPNLTRHLATDENISRYLPECNKAIYTVGLVRRNKPVIEGLSPLNQLEYNDRLGIIAPGLFGLGIAFPQAYIDRFNNHEFRVGLWKFMVYIQEVLPIWVRYGI